MSALMTNVEQSFILSRIDCCSSFSLLSDLLKSGFPQYLERGNWEYVADDKTHIIPYVMSRLKGANKWLCHNTRPNVAENNNKARQCNDYGHSGINFHNCSVFCLVLSVSDSAHDFMRGAAWAEANGYDVSVKVFQLWGAHMTTLSSKTTSLYVYMLSHILNPALSFQMPPWFCNNCKFYGHTLRAKFCPLYGATTRPYRKRAMALGLPYN